MHTEFWRGNLKEIDHLREKEKTWVRWEVDMKRDFKELKLEGGDGLFWLRIGKNGRLFETPYWRPKWGGVLLLVEETLGFQDWLFHGVNISPFTKKYSPAGVLLCSYIRLAVKFEGFSSRYACHKYVAAAGQPHVCAATFRTVELCRYDDTLHFRESCAFCVVNMTAFLSLG